MRTGLSRWLSTWLLKWKKERKQQKNKVSIPQLRLSTPSPSFPVTLQQWRPWKGPKKTKSLWHKHLVFTISFLQLVQLVFVLFTSCSITNSIGTVLFFPWVLEAETSQRRAKLFIYVFPLIRILVRVLDDYIFLKWWVSVVQLALLTRVSERYRLTQLWKKKIKKIQYKYQNCLFG